MSTFTLTGTVFARGLAAMALAASLTLAGCGGADSRTPEDVVREVFAALQKNDAAAYSKVCITQDEMLATFDKAVASGEMDKGDLDRAPKFREEIKSEFPKRIEAGMKENFAKVAKETDWSKLQIKSIDAKVKRDEGVDLCRARAELSDGRVLRVDDIVKTPSGWRIADNNPLQLTTKDDGLKLPLNPDDYKNLPSDLPKDGKGISKEDVEKAIKEGKDAVKDAKDTIKIPDVPKVP